MPILSLSKQVNEPCLYVEYFESCSYIVEYLEDDDLGVVFEGDVWFIVVFEGDSTGGGGGGGGRIKFPSSSKD